MEKTSAIKRKPRDTQTNVQQVATPPKKGQVDKSFLVLVLVITSIGMVALFSASFAHALYYYGDSYRFVTRQVLFGLAGLVFMLFFSQLDFRLLDHSKVVWGLYIVTLILLVAVFFYEPLNHARRWIHIGGFTFQPSEIAKFSVAVMLAHMINLNHHRMNTGRYGVVPPVVALIPILVLVVSEPHLSGTILILSIAAIMLFVGGVRLWWFILLAAVVGAAVFVIAVSGQIEYVVPRFHIWIDPWSDARNLGYQTIQSLFAIGSGGLMGEGIGGSIQKYLYLSELQNDYIFAIVCEELGFIGASIIIILFALLVWRGFIIAIRCNDRFGSLLAIGLTAQVGVQTILNILVVTNTIPPTGISLPFFSAGGTSLTLLLLQMGIVLSISRYSSLGTIYKIKEVVIEEEAD